MQPVIPGSGHAVRANACAAAGASCRPPTLAEVQVHRLPVRETSSDPGWTSSHRLRAAAPGRGTPCRGNKGRAQPTAAIAATLAPHTRWCQPDARRQVPLCPDLKPMAKALLHPRLTVAAHRHGPPQCPRTAVKAMRNAAEYLRLKSSAVISIRRRPSAYFSRYSG